MMAKKAGRPELRVEGSNDNHVIRNLVTRHGIQFDTDESVPTIHEAGNLENLLGSMETAISASGGRIVGFVLDADNSLQDRWAAVRNRLLNVDVVAIPLSPPASGFVGESSRYQTQVGVWIMPDNQHGGTLENFIQTLIPDDDPIYGHTTKATDEAKTLGAQFRDVDRDKAILHAWLAWQDPPGRPYGVAIKAMHFRHDSPLAQSFVTWYRKLYGISE